MTFSTDGKLGIDFTQVDTIPTQTLGATAIANDGSEYIYGQANGAFTLGAGQVVQIETTGSIFDGTLISTTTSASSRGDLVGVVQAVMADNEYGWFQIRGLCTVYVLASCAAHTQLNTTATGGQLDDDATAGAEVIENLYTLTANGGGGAAAVAAYISNAPYVGATL